MTDAIQKQPMSFPADVFATLTPTPYLLAHLTPSNSKAPSLRANGRKPAEFRCPQVNTNSLTHCNGSAVVRLGDSAVVCGVRGEILLSKDVPNPPKVELLENAAMDGATTADVDDSDELASLNVLVPNIELATGCSAAHIPGNLPSSLAQTLSQRILSLLHSTRLVRASDLRILYRPPNEINDDSDEVPPLEVAAYWTLYIDILFISLDGNPFDAAWCALLAALESTVLPKAWWDADMNSILCSEEAHEAKKLGLRGFPVPTTFVLFEPSREKGVKETRNWLLADPDSFEEELCDESVTVVVDLSTGDARVKRIEKSGGGVTDVNLMKDCVEIATRRWAEWSGILQN
ncbi:uncharacterized protein PV09_00396 [Verruconis gallopava]|uniref:Ribosomal RNA-processing protein 43 n=1 Tax=Verruconis gallopava TaxID=253628 RepID=A0A0D2ASS5_9PEZI|nr:uncharacterized protein PV09_00396 [Verruconis gallopava]KIW09520.1 hypothetical protein PV09_00396 [Verruconis gallopava]